jgi:hypothetical protein
MGTRSLTTFIQSWTDEETKKEKKSEIVTMYRQYDGYPSGHGKDLAEFLVQGKLVNGIGMSEKQLVFNGMGCLSAQVVAHFKDGAGGIYLQRANKDSWEDYRYHVIGNEHHEMTIKVLTVGYMRGDKYCKGTKVLFEGNPQEFLEFCNEEE